MPPTRQQRSARWHLAPASLQHADLLQPVAEAQLPGGGGGRRVPGVGVDAETMTAGGVDVDFGLYSGGFQHGVESRQSGGGSAVIVGAEPKRHGHVFGDGVGVGADAGGDQGVGWRNAWRASCAPRRVRPTAFISKRPRTPGPPAFRAASVTPRSTTSITTAASSAATAWKRVPPTRSRTATGSKRPVTILQRWSNAKRTCWWCWANSPAGFSRRGPLPGRPPGLCAFPISGRVASARPRRWMGRRPFPPAGYREPPRAGCCRAPNPV